MVSQTVNIGMNNKNTEFVKMCSYVDLSAYINYTHTPLQIARYTTSQTSMTETQKEKGIKHNNKGSH